VDFAVIDNRFINLRRQNRLISAVIEHNLPGIGIDDSTAVIFSHGSRTFEVFGDRSVMTFEPRFTELPRTNSGNYLSADVIDLKIFLSGNTHTVVPKNPLGIIEGITRNICPEITVELMIKNVGSTSFQWYRNDVPIEGANRYTYTVTESGIYTVSFGQDKMSLPKEVTITPCLAYEDFLGTYTMWYHATTGTPTPGTDGAPRQYSATVKLEEATWDSTYYLKGILTPADEANGTIIVQYNAATRDIEIRGQQLFVRAEDTVFCLIPEANAGSSSYTVTAPTSVSFTLRGVTSADYGVKDNKLKFEMKHLEGTWGSSSCSGFRLRNYVGGTSLGDVNGIIGRARFHHLYFEKQ